MEWTEDSIMRLRDLWEEGHSTAEIGRRMGVTKNAVVGKAHRLILPPRPSPIRRDLTPPSKRNASRRISGPTLPPLGASNVVAILQEPSRNRPVNGVVLPVSIAPARPMLRVSACCWPIGEPGTRSFRFCATDSLHGKPYCREHAQIAYVKVRGHQDNVA